jgi:N-acetylmuramic acid 6-phosphate etherase
MTRKPGKIDLQNRGLTEKDAVVGIAASGRTPYTIGAVEFARRIGCFTACVACVPDSLLTETAEIAIVPVVGAEAIAGSSRMKAGTAQKMVLNMLSTISMIRLGYVKGNRMTNVKSSNIKLKERSLRILMAETGLDETAAQNLMEKAENDLRLALVMHQGKVNRQTAKNALTENDFVVEKAIAFAKNTGENKSQNY